MTWTNNVEGDTAYDEEKISPSGGILFKATDTLSLYADYLEGLRPGQGRAFHLGQRR